MVGIVCCYRIWESSLVLGPANNMLMDKLGQQVYLANIPRFADKKAHRIKEKNKDTIKMLLSLT